MYMPVVSGVVPLDEGQLAVELPVGISNNNDNNK